MKETMTRKKKNSAAKVKGINQNLLYRWSTEFPEAGTKRPAGDSAR
ncbi:MAG: hypothetical protein OEM25_03195 [Gammaproteobacteria bacterium]|nr:hypothetical protein [Gammaproteobacteria bacterium]